MIVFRNKLYSNPMPESVEDGEQQAQGQGQKNHQQIPGVTAADLQRRSQQIQIQQMRLQRQKLLIQHQRQQMRVKENIAKARELVQRQKIDQEEREADDRMRLNVKRQEEQSSRPDNTSLYKSRSRPVQPVPMKD